MPIRQRGDSFQVDVCINGKRKQRQAPTRERALEVELELTRELGAVGDASKTKITLGEAMDLTYQRVWQDKKSDATMKKLMGIARTYWDDTRALESITSSEVDEWVKVLKKQLNANGTINRKLCMLSKVFSYAMSRDLVGAKPRFERLKEYEGRLRWLTDAEEAHVLNLMLQLSLHDHYEACCVCIDTGIRTGELVKIQVADIQGGKEGKRARLIVPERKGDTPGGIPLSDRALKILQGRSIVTEGLLFNYGEHWMRHGWEKVRNSMKLEDDPGFVPHCMRHTFASRLAQKGYPLYKIQKLMGHGTITVTQRYSHLMAGDLDDCIDFSTMPTSSVTSPLQSQLAG